MSDFFINLWAIIQLLLGFTFLIFVHELGHFLMAKKVGVRATQFAIGFGQAMLAYRKGLGWRVGTTEPELREKVLERAQKEGVEIGDDFSESDLHQLADEYGFGETEYRLNWVPFGGYVKMVGQEDLDPNAASKDPRSFTRASFWGRMGIISAGVVMNGIFAIGFFIVAFSIGVDFPPAIVGGTMPGTPGATAVAIEDPNIVGVKTGDRVISIDGDPASDFTNVLISAPLADEGVAMRFVVERPNLDGSPARTLSFDIMPAEADPVNNRPLPYVGIAMPSSIQLFLDEELSEDGKKTLSDLGLEPGMRITAIDGEPVEEHWQMLQRVDGANGSPVEITFSGGDSGASKTLKFDVVPTFPSAADPSKGVKSDSKVQHLLGLVPPIAALYVSPDAAAHGHIEKGDIFVKVNDVRWPTTAQIIAAVEGSEGEEVELTVRRGDEDVDVTIKPGTIKGKYKLGVALEAAAESNLVARVLPDSQFDKTGIVPGTKITRVGNRDIKTYTDLALVLDEQAGQTVALSVTRPVGTERDSTYQFAVSAKASEQLADVGWTAVDVPMLRQLRVTQKADGVVEAATMGFEKTHLIMMQTYLTLLKTIKGWIPLENLHGPVGIVAQGKNVTKRGFAYLMFFLGLISINLAVINFLPMPIVDGGLAVLLILEKIRGKPLPPSVAGAVNMVGLVLILTLFVTLTYHDIVKIVTG